MVSHTIPLLHSASNAKQINSNRIFGFHFLGVKGGIFTNSNEWEGQMTI
jgi:hypothetical protein